MSKKRYLSKNRKTNNNNLEKNKLLINTIAVIAIPVVLAFVGNSYSTALKEKEIQAKFVEIAINILDEPIDSVNSQINLRKWSVDVINRYSGVPFDSAATNDLINNSPLFSEKKKNDNIYLYSNSQFIGKPIRVHFKFAESLNRLNNYAKKQNLLLYVTSSYRKHNKKFGPPTMSTHYAGYAIDINIKFEDQLFNSKKLNPKNFNTLPKEIRAFIDLVRNDLSLEWGGDYNIPDPTHIGGIISNEELKEIIYE